jgi:hypothetical protein
MQTSTSTGLAIGVVAATPARDGDRDAVMGKDWEGED